MNDKVKFFINNLIQKNISNKNGNNEMDFLDDLDEKIIAEDEIPLEPLKTQLKGVKKPVLEGFEFIKYKVKNVFNKLYLFDFTNYNSEKKESWKGAVRGSSKQEAIKNAKLIYSLDYEPDKIDLVQIDKDRLIDNIIVDPSLIGGRKKINKMQLGEFLVEYASLMEDGFNKEDTIKNVNDIIKDPGIREFMEELKNSSYKMSQIMKKKGGFDDYTITIIESAESSGGSTRFYDGIKHLGKSYIAEEEFRKKFIGSLIYPLVLFGIIMLITYISLKYVMPALTGLFAEIAGKDNLPGYMVSMIETGNNLNFMILQLMGIIGILYFILKVLSTNNFILVKWNLLKLKLPLFGIILQAVEENRIIRIFVQTLDSNLSHLDKITSFEKSTSSELYKRVFRYMHKIYPMKQNIISTFEEANEKFGGGIFSQRYLTILRLAKGEKPKILQKYNTFLEKNTEKLMGKLSTIKNIITIGVTISIATMVGSIFFVITTMVINLTDKI